ncbi:myelin-associated glycoprotein-like [Colossoma macropomum]|uniref:myelin-associated glycoprotein-like n=1 Tax=Colossoma macropomum TaxID=42526 RepID=UPI0018656B4A|nr:myelin-associated glycoprotein-like [Colossoma macropomum]
MLNILYAPEDVKIDGADRSVVEGGAISLMCTSKSNPEPTDYEWLVTQKGSTTTKTAPKSFPLEAVKRDTSVSCTARNSAGRGQSKQVLLNVHFPPTILVNSTCSGSAGGLRCVCRVEAAPKANVSWTVNGSSALLPHFSTMTKHAGGITVSELTGPPASNVSCKASNIVGTDTYQMPIQHSVSEVPPSILMNSTCFVSAGGVQCVCRAEAEPQPNIFWMVDGSSAVHPHFNTTTTYAGRIAVSELTGPPASNVSCKASNVVGTDTYQMPILHSVSDGSAFLNGV